MIRDLEHSSQPKNQLPLSYVESEWDEKPPEAEMPLPSFILALGCLGCVCNHRFLQGAALQILTVKEAIDAFFDQVMVMADDAAIRQNRLALLTAIAQLFLRVGDFSKMSAA